MAQSSLKTLNSLNLRCHATLLFLGTDSVLLLFAYCFLSQVCKALQKLWPPQGSTPPITLCGVADLNSRFDLHNLASDSLIYSLLQQNITVYIVLTWRISCMIPFASACALNDMYCTESFTSIWQNSTLFECHCIWNESATLGHYCYVPSWRRGRHFTWSSKPREGLAACTAKGVPSFLSYFKTLSIGPAPGIEPATSCSVVKCSADWDNPATVKKLKYRQHQLL